MSEEIISASGERAALGGYLPQFDEFAWFVYLNLINKKLEWIRIADPKAEKLDDIQYSTHSEIHAYQVKWTIADAVISYSNFFELFPLIASSWKSLKKNNPDKTVIPHLITNKPLSTNDSIKVLTKKIGSFDDFYNQVLLKIKSNLPTDDKWQAKLDELQKASNLNKKEFKEFMQVLDFQPSYKQKKFAIANARNNKEQEDLQVISRYIIEKVASPQRNVQFSRLEIIKELGWTERFKTTFNHDLIVDRKRYQPIQSTIDQLNLKIAQHKNGYLFLKGGPGAGKSTLLNQWSKGVAYRIARYFAFDFVNPSSSLNFHERGNAVHLFFDLVFQLKEMGIFNRSIILYKDLILLKEIFDEQLTAVGKEFETDGQPTVILIDGLDHVPREYKNTIDSFLRQLPLPEVLPEGVYIILGSQSFELEDIPQEIQKEYQDSSRTVLIDPLKKEEVYSFIDSLDGFTPFTSQEKLKIFEKSQGHPLYLTYLLEKINQSKSFTKTIASFDTIDGDIENYYSKIWMPIQKQEDLVDFLGLMARINGSINLSFVKEWGFNRSILKSFNEKARVLFNETADSLSFFHNSFKQFLLFQTSLDYLNSNQFDEKMNLDYHSRLADYYHNSATEKKWKRNHHLFQAELYQTFVLEATPESFTDQLLNFRPVDEIRQEAKLGIEIALRTKDIVILTRYLFTLSEIERRLFTVNPASFTEELLTLNKHEQASEYLRTGNILHCSQSTALSACSLFMDFGYKTEAEILYNLAYPELITETGITLDDFNDYESARDTLVQWICTAPHFENIEDILSKTENIYFAGNTKNNRFQENAEDLQIRLLINLGYVIIDQNKWDDLNKVIAKIASVPSKAKKSLFELLKYTIEKCLDLNDIGRAQTYLNMLKTYFTKKITKPKGRIFIADLIYKVTGETDEAFRWIEGIQQPSKIGVDNLGYDDSLDLFVPLIKFNKILNLHGQGVSITVAIPAAKAGSDEQVLVEFERMLCLITEIMTDGILKKDIAGTLIERVFPIINFYYRDLNHLNSYWYKIKAAKGEYFDFLINAVSQSQKDNVQILGQYLLSEFKSRPEYWSAEIQRKIIESLVIYGYDHEKIMPDLEQIESFMLENYDLDGRVNQCISHANAWLLLGNLSNGEKWLKKAIQESIGVGYRKDYQFSEWISWLRKINKLEPSKAAERIKSFLPHLSHIKESTEGRAFWNASDELLECGFEHNLADGLKQAIWQLENNLVDFSDAAYHIIKQSILKTDKWDEFKCIIPFYTDFYLLLAEAPNISLLATVFKRGYELFEDQFLNHFTAVIVTAINTKALEENRHYLLEQVGDFFASIGKGIEEFCTGFTIPPLKNADNSTSTSNSLVLLPDYKSLTEKEVLDKVHSFDDLKKLVEQEDQANSYFNWSKTIDSVASSLTSGQIEDITNLPKAGRRESDFYAKFSEVAAALHDNHLAEKLAHKSISLSSDSGWVKHYDGGTRIKAFVALKKVNPALSFSIAFEVFSHDVMTTNFPSSYIQHLDDILPLLSEDFTEQKVWPEIFAYVQRLMSNSKATTDIPDFQSPDQPVIETLTDYLMYLLKSPVTFIYEKSVLLFASLIDNADSYAIAQVLGNAIEDIAALDIIMALYNSKSSALSKLTAKIHTLAGSNNYNIRENAKTMLKELKEKVPVSKSIRLPGIYTLLLPDPKSLIINKKALGQALTVNLENPKDLTRPFNSWIRILAAESGIEEANLFYRTTSLMKEIGNEEHWTDSYEKKLRTHLEETSLKYSFRKPRVITARRAIMHVVSELVDAKTIDGDSIQSLVLTKDYAVQHFNEIPKPEFIQSLSENSYGGVGTQWVERINQSKRKDELLIGYSENFTIIAEYNQITNLDWGSPTEEYMYQISHKKVFRQTDEYIFTSAFQELSINYHELHIAEDYIIIIRDHRFEQFNLKSQWIAINPSLARSLNWTAEPSKLFAWKNKQGELMAESLYWSNGNIEMHPRKDSDVGEGWFVAISDKGLEQIRKLKSKLYIQKKIKRFQYKDSILQEEEIFSTHLI